MKNKEDKTATEIFNWCETQEEKTKKTIDMLLDTEDWQDKKTKKALTIASKILKSVDELKQTTLDIIIK
jgi:hypothetical protein